MERVNRWKTYTNEQLEEVEKISSRYKRCLDAGKTERDSVSLAVDMAKAAGYRDLAEYVKESDGKSACFISDRRGTIREGHEYSRCTCGFSKIGCETESFI